MGQPNRKSSRHVALAFPTHFAHLPAIVRGIADYARAHGSWVFTTSGESFNLPIQALSKWRGDGVVALLQNARDAAAARRLKVPVVTFVGLVQNPGVPRVMVDQAAIGRLAAEHLIARGFQRFAFYGLKDVGYSVIRQRAFTQHLAARGFPVHHYLSPNTFDRRKPWEDEMESLARWFKRLPAPVGLLAVNDPRARLAADACRFARRRVPEEIGIIGVDNYELACEFGSPTLTSISVDWRLIGFEVARLLDRLMRGGAPPGSERLIAPTGVVARQSTDVMIVEHPIVARAVAYARANPAGVYGVEALVSASGVSRRHLEILFRRTLKVTPLEYLVRLRIERAKDLLRERGRTLTEVARQCGFSDLRHFRRVFRRVGGVTPMQYRRAAVATAAAPAG